MYPLAVMSHVQPRSACNYTHNICHASSEIMGMHSAKTGGSPPRRIALGITIINDRSRAQLDLLAQLSSAAPSGSVRCRARPCGAMLYRLCRAACFAVLTVSYMPGIIHSIIRASFSLIFSSLFFSRQQLLHGVSYQVSAELNLTYQLISAQLSSTVHRIASSAAQCRALPCFAVLRA